MELFSQEISWLGLFSDLQPALDIAGNIGRRIDRKATLAERTKGGGWATTKRRKGKPGCTNCVDQRVTPGEGNQGHDIKLGRPWVVALAHTL